MLREHRKIKDSLGPRGSTRSVAGCRLARLAASVPRAAQRLVPHHGPRRPHHCAIGVLVKRRGDVGGQRRGARGTEAGREQGGEA